MPLLEKIIILDDVPAETEEEIHFTSLIKTIRTTSLLIF